MGWDLLEIRRGLHYFKWYFYKGLFFVQWVYFDWYFLIEVTGQSSIGSSETCFYLDRQLLRASSNNTKAQMPLMNTAGIKRGIKRSVIIIGAEAEVGPRRETTTNTARVRRSPNIVKTQKRGRAEVLKKSKNMEWVWLERGECKWIAFWCIVVKLNLILKMQEWRSHFK